ncbi:hypothetical protein CYMTET_29904 [Cymbomonas tetramitiformis]|uniref:Uncharacterized protein n=1 Tax=Cymbomonas tetramitiformis TaxID=36881 RepID=A0AAE0FK55_9CHLO|nr:hypothetical protein CYMTET_29904 [Cymbomonas tetramitiformis]
MFARCRPVRLAASYRGLRRGLLGQGALWASLADPCPIPQEMLLRRMMHLLYSVSSPLAATGLHIGLMLAHGGPSQDVLTRTGGFFAVWLALSRCHKISIFGFNFASGYGVPHHYFNGEKPRKGKVAIHDYELEHGLIVKLAAMSLLNFSEPCVAGCTKGTGIQYHNLAPGSGCQCENKNPLPVALPGFCRVAGSFVCFYKCPGGVEQCPGGMGLQLQLGDKLKPIGPVDGEMGDCPQELMGTLSASSDMQGKDVVGKCATWDDVETDSEIST